MTLKHQAQIDAEEDKVLALADHIRAKRRNRHLLATLKTKETVTIRWDIPNEDARKLGAGYAGFEVPTSLILHLAETHFKEK